MKKILLFKIETYILVCRAYREHGFQKCEYKIERSNYKIPNEAHGWTLPSHVPCSHHSHKFIPKTEKKNVQSLVHSETRFTKHKCNKLTQAIEAQPPQKWKKRKRWNASLRLTPLTNQFIDFTRIKLNAFSICKTKRTYKRFVPIQTTTKLPRTGL